jgi:hypothetical protein
LEIEYEITRADLYTFQWRAVFESARGRRARRMAYLGWLLAVLLFAIVPAIGADGFMFSRVSFAFIVISLLVVFLFQWCLERWLVRRAIGQLLKDERPDRGQLGRHRVGAGLPPKERRIVGARTRGGSSARAAPATFDSRAGTGGARARSPARSAISRSPRASPTPARSRPMPPSSAGARTSSANSGSKPETS